MSVCHSQGSLPDLPVEVRCLAQAQRSPAQARLTKQECPAQDRVCRYRWVGCGDGDAAGGGDGGGGLKVGEVILKVVDVPVVAAMA